MIFTITNNLLKLLNKIYDTVAPNHSYKIHTIMCNVINTSKRVYNAQWTNFRLNIDIVSRIMCNEDDTPLCSAYD